MDRTLEEATNPQKICSTGTTCHSRTPQKPLPLGKAYKHILQENCFKSTTHERCIYQTKIKNQQVLFLRQVDDFAVASKAPSKAKAVIAQIGAIIQIPLNHLCMIAKFNGIDVLQTWSHMKITC